MEGPGSVACMVALWAALWLSFVVPAEAQLPVGSLRLTLDADVISFASVRAGPGPNRIVSLGPNQHGGSLVSGGPTPVGVSVGYVVAPKLLLGLRVSLGYDRTKGDDYGPGPLADAHYLDVTLMPELTFVPYGQRSKLFLSVAPLYQISRISTSTDGRRHIQQGGFGLGVGSFFFVGDAVSADLGFHFEGRFGNSQFNGDDSHGIPIQDLRALVRLGLSLWT